jgi:hypothetical protein
MNLKPERPTGFCSLEGNIFVNVKEFAETFPGSESPGMKHNCHTITWEARRFFTFEYGLQAWLVLLVLVFYVGLIKNLLPE